MQSDHHVGLPFAGRGATSLLAVAALRDDNAIVAILIYAIWLFREGEVCRNQF